MSWIIIIGVFILAAGPLFYLMPTAKDKRLTALRSDARKLGFTIQLDGLLKLDPTPDERVTAGGQTRNTKTQCMRYQLALGQSLNHLSAITLQRIPAHPTVPVTVIIDGWGLPADEASLTKMRDQTLAAWQRQSQLLALLHGALQQMPVDVLGISIDGRSLGAFWREQRTDPSDSITTIAAEPLNVIHTAMIEIIDLLKSHPWEME
jgi:hypothetical protein